MGDFEWEEVYTIIEHAETAFEFDVSVQTQYELNQVIADYYGRIKDEPKRIQGYGQQP